MEQLRNWLETERDALLIRKIPSLTELFPEHAGDVPPVHFDKNLRESLGRLLACLGPLVWFLEDLHWAGPITLDLLEPLARYPVLATCQYVDHRLCLTIREMEGISARRIHIEKRQSTEGSSDSEDTIDAEDSHSVDGDPLWVDQSPWLEHEEERLDALTLVNRTASSIGRFAEELDFDEQQVLQLAACFGFDVEEYLLDICYDGGGTLSSILVRLEQTGVLRTYRDNHWRFVDDDVQVTAYGWIRDPEHWHMRNGRLLWQAYVADEVSDVFPIASQLCRASTLLTDEAERVRVAGLLLHAARQASAASYFELAAMYLVVAIDLLSSCQTVRHWRDEYHLTLNVWETAAEVQIRIGNFDRAESLLSIVLQHARSLEDTILVMTLSIIIAGCRNYIPTALRQALKALEMFGVTFNTNMLLPRVVYKYVRVRSCLARMTDEDFRMLPVVQDPLELAQQRFMMLAHEYALLSNPTLSALISLRMMEHTLKVGISSVAAGACVSMGMVLCCGFGNIPLGTRYSDLGLELLDRFGSSGREILPRVAAESYVFVKLSTQPVSSILRPLLLTHRIGLGSGDIETSMVLAAFYAQMALFACVPLKQLDNDITAFIALMRRYKQQTAIQLLLPVQQFVVNLIGRSDNPTELSGDVLDEASFLAEVDAAESEALRGIYNMQNKLFLKSYFGDVTKDLLKGMPNFLSDSTDPYSVGLVHLHVGLAHSASNRRRKARVCLRRLQKLVPRNPQSYANKALLLEYALSGDRAILEQSVSLAREEGLWSEVGLAYEWASEWELAAQAYEQWGATAKVERAREKIIGSTSTYTRQSE